MSRPHVCPGDECGICAVAIDAAEEARDGHPHGWSQADLDARADGAAADAAFGRWDQ